MLLPRIKNVSTPSTQVIFSFSNLSQNWPGLLHPQPTLPLLFSFQILSTGPAWNYPFLGKLFSLFPHFPLIPKHFLAFTKSTWTLQCSRNTHSSHGCLCFCSTHAAKPQHLWDFDSSASQGSNSQGLIKMELINTVQSQLSGTLKIAKI